MLFWYFLPPDSLIEEKGAAYLPELETTCPQASLSLRGPQETIQPHTHRAVSQDSGLKTDVKAGWDLPVWLEGRNLFYFSGHGEPWEHLRQGHLDEGADFRDDPGNV